jgi:hypothetical protein
MDRRSIVATNQRRRCCVPSPTIWTEPAVAGVASLGLFCRAMLCCVWVVGVCVSTSSQIGPRPVCYYVSGLLALPRLFLLLHSFEVSRDHQSSYDHHPIYGSFASTLLRGKLVYSHSLTLVHLPVLPANKERLRPIPTSGTSILYHRLQKRTMKFATSALVLATLAVESVSAGTIRAHAHKHVHQKKDA